MGVQQHSRCWGIRVWSWKCRSTRLTLLILRLTVAPKMPVFSATSHHDLHITSH
jgi:hypothetical protein